MCPGTWKRVKDVPRGWCRKGCQRPSLWWGSSPPSGPAFVMFWQQMGGHWSWLWATGDTRRLIGNRSHTRIHTHLWLLSRVHSRARADQAQCRTSHTQYHTLNYSDSHVDALQQCVTHIDTQGPLFVPRGRHLGVRGRGSGYCFWWRAWETRHRWIMPGSWRDRRTRRMNVLCRKSPSLSTLCGASQREAIIATARARRRTRTGS